MAYRNWPAPSRWPNGGLRRPGRVSTAHGRVGPESGRAILVASTLTPLIAGDEDAARYTELDGMLVVLTGAFLIAAGLGGLGSVADYRGPALAAQHRARGPQRHRALLRPGLGGGLEGQQTTECFRQVLGIRSLADPI